MTLANEKGKTLKSIANEYRKGLIENETARARAKVASEARQRMDAYDFALKALEHVVAARKALDDRYDDMGYMKEVSAGAIAKQMSGVLGRDWSRTTVANQLYRADERIIEHAVLECRTRMTAQALSADFSRNDVTALEAEYLEIIAEAIDLGHKMRGERGRTRQELLTEAKDAATEVAFRQRRSKGVSMAARERLWDGFAPFPRRVFEDEREQ